MLCKILNNISASASECEIESAFENGQATTAMRLTLIEIYHPQPPALMKVNNTITIIFINGSLKEKCTKSVDVKFYWLKYRQEQKMITISLETR